MELNAITGEIIDSALEVHRALGPGLLESVYEAALSLELRSRNFEVQTQLVLPVIYKGQDLGMGFRLDMLVEARVIVELKSIERLEKVHHKQLQTYLKLADKRVGLLLNFNEELLRDGIKRIANRI